MLNNKFFIKVNLYIIFFYVVLFINLIFSTNTKADTFKIRELEISEPFELGFDKNKVLDRGFIKAFKELLSMISTSDEKKKLGSTSLNSIKSLIDSFTISDEKFIKNTYFANLDVNFNKDLTLRFFENKNVFPSIPKEKTILLIPVLFDISKDQIYLFSNNKFYQSWNKNIKRFELLNYVLPSEDIEDLNNLIQKKDEIEDFDFKSITKKYDLDDYIITIIFYDNKDIKILSKININNSLKLNNLSFENVNILNKKDFDFILNSTKKVYENYWKNLNKINTSIKLPITIKINSSSYLKILNLEKNLSNLDLVSSYNIDKFNNNNTFFKVIYNGSPKKFIDDMKDKNIDIFLEDDVWTVK